MVDTLGQDGAANYLGVSVPHFQSLCRSGVFPGFKRVSGEWAARVSSLDAYRAQLDSSSDPATVEQFFRELVRV
jgi:hypothetical protein